MVARDDLVSGRRMNTSRFQQKQTVFLSSRHADDRQYGRHRGVVGASERSEYCQVCCLHLKIDTKRNIYNV